MDYDDQTKLEQDAFNGEVTDYLDYEYALTYGVVELDPAYVNDNE